MPLSEEDVEVEVVVHKRPVVNAEVSIDTRPVQATERVSGKVRRELLARETGQLMAMHVREVESLARAA